MDASGRVLKGLFLLVLAGGGLGCRVSPNDPLYPDTRPAPTTLADRSELQAELQRARERKDRRLVWVDAKDIELPQTSDYDEPPDEREYTFYIWALHPQEPGRDVEGMIQRKELIVDVVGVEGMVIAPVEALHGSTLRMPEGLRAQLDEEQKSASEELRRRSERYEELANRVRELEKQAGVDTGAGDPLLPPAEAGASPELLDLRRQREEAAHARDAARLDVKRVQALSDPAQEDADTAGGQDRGRLAPQREGGWTRKLANVVAVKVRSSQVTQSFTVGAGFPRYYDQAERDRQRDIDDLFDRLARAPDALPGAAPRPAGRCVPRRPSGNAGPSDMFTKRDYFAAIEERRLEPNPYIDIKRVRAFNGDLHTQVYMLSRTEVSDAFGEMFERYFAVGRTYFRNRHPDKTLVVNTTSIRARCLFYREPDPAAARAFFGQDRSRELRRYEYLNQTPAQLVGARTPPASTGAGTGKLFFEKLVRYARHTYCACDRQDTTGLAQELDIYFGDEAWRPGASRKALEARDTPGAKRPGQIAEARAIVEDARLMFQQICEACGQDHDRAWQLIQAAEVELAQRYLNQTQPVEFPLPLPVTPHDKRAATSRNVYRQGMLAGAGYLFEDYYRPMTLRAVLVSLMAKTDQDPYNQALRWLEALGIAGGALVGADAISGGFASKSFAQLMAVTTGVFIPELRKLLLRDVEKFIRNLNLLGLDTVIKISPGESTDGYVFFPKGPIFGFGVDEYAPSTPTYIVNVDNDDVSADGLLVNAAHEFSSGTIDEKALLDKARSEGLSLRRERERELVEMNAKIGIYQLYRLETEVREALEKKDLGRAQRLVASYVAQHGTKDPTGTLSKIHADAQLTLGATPTEMLDTESARAGRGPLLLDTSEPLGAKTTLPLARVEPEEGVDTFSATYRLILSEPPRDRTERLLRMRVLGLDRIKDFATVSFTVTKAGTTAPSESLAFSVLGFTRDGALAKSEPRLAEWSQGYTITVRCAFRKPAEGEPSLLTAATRDLLQSAVSILHEDISSGTAQPRDVRTLTLELGVAR